MSNELLALLWRVFPGYVVGILTLFALPRARVEVRLVVYILLFVLFRDAMTPLGLWYISPGMAIRFTAEPSVLVDLGLAGFAAVFTINVFDPELGRLLVWFRGKPYWAILAGCLGAGLIAGPVSWVRHVWLHGMPLPPVSYSLFVPILVLALLGNFLEEALFRGYFQGLMERNVSPLRAALLSGLFFGFCHTFLATTVTNLGAPLIAFAWYEGTIAGLLRMRYGVMASTLAHGGAIFLLASGLAG